MIRLKLQSGPEWIDLGNGVKVECQPYTTLMTLAAREDPALRDIDPENASQSRLAYGSGVAIARLAISDWDGVGDEDGNPVDPTPETVEKLMAIPQFYDAFFAKYLVPALVLDAEKNGSTPSPDGTTAGAPDTVKRARKSATNARKRKTRQ